MPVPIDLNARIALAKGWTWSEEARVVNPKGVAVPPNPYGYCYTHWRNPQGYWCARPDFVGTLGGISELLRELNEKETNEVTADYDWAIRWSRLFQIWDVWAEDGYSSSDKRLAQFQSTKGQGLGIAIGDAWLSMFEKEDADASTE